MTKKKYKLARKWVIFGDQNSIIACHRQFWCVLLTKRDPLREVSPAVTTAPVSCDAILLAHSPDEWPGDALVSSVTLFTSHYDIIVSDVLVLAPSPLPRHNTVLSPLCDDTQ